MLSEPNWWFRYDPLTTRPSLSLANRRAYTPEKSPMGFSERRLYPDPAVRERRWDAGALRVTMFTEAPMASASMSGVRVLFTSMAETISEGIRSS